MNRRASTKKNDQEEREREKIGIEGIFQALRHLDHASIDADLEPFALLLESLGKHELAHPVDALLAVLDGKVMGLTSAVDTIGKVASLDTVSLLEPARLLRRGHKLEGECSDVRLSTLALSDVHGLESGAELGLRSIARAGYGIVVNINVLEGTVNILRILVHGEPRALEGKVAILPLMAEEVSLSLLHRALISGAVQGGGPNCILNRYGLRHAGEGRDSGFKGLRALNRRPRVVYSRRRAKRLLMCPARWRRSLGSLSKRRRGSPVLIDGGHDREGRSASGSARHGASRSRSSSSRSSVVHVRRYRLRDISRQRVNWHSHVGNIHLREWSPTAEIGYGGDEILGKRRGLRHSIRNEASSRSRTCLLHLRLHLIRRLTDGDNWLRSRCRLCRLYMAKCRLPRNRELGEVAKALVRRLGLRENLEWRGRGNLASRLRALEVEELPDMVRLVLGFGVLGASKGGQAKVLQRGQFARAHDV